MKHTHPLAAALVAAGLCAALPAAASSTASSAASDSASSTASSASDSSKGSSNSSAGDNRNAAGPYRVVEVAEVQDRPADLRLTLRAEAEGRQTLQLFVPRATVQAHGVQAGQVIHAQPRPYGVEFAHGETQRTFFLVLDDAWHRELRTKAVTL